MANSIGGTTSAHCDDRCVALRSVAGVGLLQSGFIFRTTSDSETPVSNGAKHAERENRIESETVDRPRLQLPAQNSSIIKNRTRASLLLGNSSRGDVFASLQKPERELAERTKPKKQSGKEAAKETKEKKKAAKEKTTEAQKKQQEKTQAMTQMVLAWVLVAMVVSKILGWT